MSNSRKGSNSKFKKTTRSEATMHLLRDIAVIILSVLVAIAIAKTGVIHGLAAAVGHSSVIPVFITGIFFTSMFTIAPASIVLAELGQTMGMWEVVVWGALGSLVGDMLIFFFMRDEVATDLELVIRGKYFRKITRWSHFGFMRWIVPLVGGLIIASPLPDEIGLALMGITRVKIIYVIPIVFLMDMLGVWAIVVFGRGV